MILHNGKQVKAYGRPRPNKQPARQQLTLQLGVGTELKRLLFKLGLKPAPGCKCNQHILEMNRNGIEWCEDNIPTIIGWLKEEADRAKLPFFEIGARILIKRAISKARKHR